MSAFGSRAGTRDLSPAPSIIELAMCWNIRTRLAARSPGIGIDQLGSAWISLDQLGPAWVSLAGALSGWKHCLCAALAENFATGIECLHRPAIVVALALRRARACVGDGAAVHHISGIRDG
jgi:hypothetical protein